MNFVEYPDREMMMMDLAHKISGALNDHLLTEAQATLAVPGGTTPGPMFDALSGAKLDWAKVRVIPTDERWLDESAGRSNTRLIRKRLLTDRAAAAQMVALHLDTERPEDAIEALTPAVAEALPISVLLLGMGADLHIASLFPGAEGLEAAMAADAPPLVPIRTASQPEPRITLSAPVLRGALATHILITGPEKREALERVAEITDPMAAPVLVVLNEATVHWAE